MLNIDEYDEAINDAYVKFFTSNPEEFKKVLHLIREILSSVLKDNPYLEKGILTGILKKVSINKIASRKVLVSFNITGRLLDKNYVSTSPNGKSSYNI